MVSRRRRCFLFSMLLCFVLVWLLVSLLTVHNQAEVEYHHIKFAGTHRCSLEQTGTSLGLGKRRKKFILFYTTIFDRIPVFYPDTYKCCQPLDCILTTDKSEISQSDAVIFHTRDVPASNKMPIKGRRRNQRWIFWTLENPYHTGILAKDYNDMFNWTMSYEQRSDVFYPYGFYQKKSNVESEFL